MNAPFKQSKLGKKWRGKTLYVKMQLMKKCNVLLPSLNHCTKHFEHLRCPLINSYVVLAQWRMQTSGKVSLQLFVEQMQGIGLMQVFAFSQLVCGRTDGVSRVSKRLAIGWRALGTKPACKRPIRASKRPRSLTNPISHYNRMRNHMVLVIKAKIPCLWLQLFMMRS
jgi:hypothetical protein